MTYARGTDVPIERSRAEIEKTLQRYGASHFAYMTEPTRAVIAFVANDRRIRFDLPLPPREQFALTAQGKQRTPPQIESARDQACREKWRALGLCIKAKLESVEAGIETFEDAFLAHVVMPDGQTVAEHARPRIAQAYETGTTQPLLPAPRP